MCCSCYTGEDVFFIHYRGSKIQVFLLSSHEMFCQCCYCIVGVQFSTIVAPHHWCMDLCYLRLWQCTIKNYLNMNMKNQSDLKIDKVVTIKGPSYSTNDLFWWCCIPAVSNWVVIFSFLIFKAMSNQKSFTFWQWLKSWKWLKDLFKLLPNFQHFGLKSMKRLIFGFLIESFLIPVYCGLNFVKGLKFTFSSFSKFKPFHPKMP